MSNGKILNTRIRFPEMNIKNQGEYCAMQDINNFQFPELENQELNYTISQNRTGNGMTERQKLIIHKQVIQSAKNKLKQMPGIDVLGIVGLDEHPCLNEMFSAYTSAFGNDVEPYSRLSCKSPVETVYSWLIDTMGLKENNEYFFFCGVWCRIKLLDLRLAVPSLWMHNGNTKGFLLAETDLSRMLEAGSDSRDEYNYLVDIWTQK